jgi:putative addiction module component (TIGR02574 family)
VNARAKQLLDEVLELSTEERDAFTAELLRSLDAPPDSRTDRDWAVEIDRRAAEALRDDWRGHTWDEVRAAAEERIRRSRGE